MSRSVSDDFDGDGRSDVAVFRPATGTWYISLSGGGTTTTAWGASGDVPVPGDYNGDGKTDIAVFRPATGTWYISLSGGGGATVTSWGANGDVAVPGDYNGDGKTDVAVFRPATGTWYISLSGGGTTTTAWGASGDVPVPGDYNGDGKTDVAVFRPATGTWYISLSGGGGTTTTSWGASGDHAIGQGPESPLPAPPPTLLQVSSDPYSNASSEHATEVEPDSLSKGSTLVSAFQVGRFNNGGANDTGWATSTDNGSTWTHGVLPGITTFQGGGPWARVSDPSVAYDAKHGAWMIAGLVLDSSVTGRGVSVNRSADGLNWTNPVTAVSTTTGNLDKDWIVCDSTPTSPHYGNCYIEYDNNASGNLVQMLISTDGGITWSAPRQTADAARGLGGQPLVQPNGTVVVPYLDDGAGQIRAFVSTDGGTTWASSVLVSSATTHTVAAGLRTSPLPTAEIDAAGTVYLSWQDCRFRSGCPANDIVLSKSTNGTTWSAVQRIPIDAATSSVDHFIPGLAVDRATSGTSAHLALYYYYYPNSACSASTCQLDVGFVSSADGGSTWSSATQVAGPMTVAQIAPTTQGPMVGDYISASFLSGRAYSVFAVGAPPSGSAFNEAMSVPTGGLAATGGQRRADTWTGPDSATPSPAVPARSPLTAY